MRWTDSYWYQVNSLAAWKSMEWLDVVFVICLANSMLQRINKVKWSIPKTFFDSLSVTVKIIDFVNNYIMKKGSDCFERYVKLGQKLLEILAVMILKLELENAFPRSHEKKLQIFFSQPARSSGYRLSYWTLTPWLHVVNYV